MPELLTALLLMPTLVGVVAIARRAEHRDQQRQGESYRLDFPREVETQAVIAALAGLSGLGAPGLLGGPVVTLEAVADATGIRHYLTVPGPVTAYVTGQLRAVLPSVRLTAEPDYRVGAITVGRELRSTSTRRALRTDRPEAASAGLLSTLHPLTDERVVVQWLVTPSRPRRPVPRSTRLPRAHHPLGPWLDPYWLDSAEDRRALADKSREPLFLASCRLGVRASNRRRAQALLRRVGAAFATVGNPGVRLVPRLRPAGLVGRHLERRSVPLLLPWPVLINAAELAGVCGWPIGSPLIAGLRLGGCRQLPPAREVPSEGTVIGQATFPGAERPVAIGPVERRRHIWCASPTGAGKSTLILNLFVQDVQGDGAVVVFDSKGDLIEDALALVPARRIPDVIVLDAADTGRPVGFNLLNGPAAERDLIVSNVVGIFRSIYGSGSAASWGPRVEDILRCATATLGYRPGMTLCELPRLLSDDRWRRTFTEHINDPLLLGFWQWYDRTSKAERASATAPLMNKLRSVLRRRMRLILGQTEGGIDFDAVLNDGRILLVSLAKGVLGEETYQLLGALVLAKLWQAITHRAALPEHERRPAFLHIDEAQDVLHLPTPIPDLTAQARGLGVGLSFFHQHLAQLDSDTRAALLANCRSKISFQLSADDARLVAREFQPYLSAEDLQGLGPYEIVAQVAAGGSVVPPLTARTFPAPLPLSDPAVVREASRQRWGRERAEVEAAMVERQQIAAESAPVGRTRRQP